MPLWQENLDEGGVWDRKSSWNTDVEGFLTVVSIAEDSDFSPRWRLQPWHTYRYLRKTRSKRVESKSAFLAECTPTSLLSPSSCNDERNLQTTICKRRWTEGIAEISAILLISQSAVLLSSYNSRIKTISKNKLEASTPKARYPCVVFIFLSNQFNTKSWIFCVLRALKLGFDQTPSTQYWPMIRYHPKQKGRNGRKFFRLGPIRPIQFYFYYLNRARRAKWAGLLPFHWLAFEQFAHNFAACHFREQKFGYWSEYNFLRLWSELTSVTFSGNWPLETLLRLASCKQ